MSIKIDNIKIVIKSHSINVSFVEELTYDRKYTLSYTQFKLQYTFFLWSLTIYKFVISQH